MKLYYTVLGATPKGRNIEQHDVFFGLAETLKDLVPQMRQFWSEADGKIHIDCYQEVQFADGYEVYIVEKKPTKFQNSNYFSSILVDISWVNLKNFISSI